MPKAKMLNAETLGELQGKVNDFISDKNVIDVSFAINPEAKSFRHCCCIIYERRE